MIAAMLQGDEIVTTGQIEVRDSYSDICCDGFRWVALLIFPDEKPGWNSVYGGCQNPDCPQEDFPGDPYKGVTVMCQDDIVEKVATSDKATV